MCDVDYFKKFNDHCGHQAGDDCLRAVAQVIAGQMNRPGDMAARYGGEEFVCVLPDTDLSGAQLVAETIRTELATLGLPHPASSVGHTVSLSLGVATAVPSQHCAAYDLIALADAKLYEAKNSGRNRFCAALMSSAAAET